MGAQLECSAVCAEGEIPASKPLEEGGQVQADILVETTTYSTAFPQMWTLDRQHHLAWTGNAVSGPAPIFQII